MRFPIPTDTSVIDRLRMFERDVDDRLERVDAELARKRHILDDRSRLKTERAQIEIMRHNFKQLFERELSEP